MRFTWVLPDCPNVEDSSEHHEFKIIAEDANLWNIGDAFAERIAESLWDYCPVPIRFLKVSTDERCIAVIYLKNHWPHPTSVQLCRWLEREAWSSIRVGYAAVANSPILAQFMDDD